MLNLSTDNNDAEKFAISMMINPEGLRGTLRRGEPMSKHTSWRVGGKADVFYIPYDQDDLKLFLSRLDSDEPITWIGLGSNLLVRDGGIRGTVIATKKMNSGVEKISTTEIKAGAATSCAQLARFTVNEGMHGAEFLVGIPGTFGGALAMNAGAFGFETWDIIKTVCMINRRGQITERKPAEFKIAYRSVTAPEQEWFLSAIIELEMDKGDSSENTMRDLLKKRSDTQPVGEASCGSVFRNPVNASPAAKLIDDCDLKGTEVGGARISDKHANFIINTGKATAADIEDLIQHIQKTVSDKHGISLLTEVRIIGEKIKEDESG
jgi:UDP-N-acetylmuramate dehydrogenase